MNQTALELEKIKQSNEQRKQVEIEESLEKLSEYLDGLFRIPGTKWRFGLDALVGLIPNFGDTLTTLISFYILIAGVRYGVPKITLLRMAMNIAIDYIVGAIPFVGDAFDFFWKANKRNLDLIRERATKKNAGTTSDYIFVFGIIGLLISLLIGSILASLYLISLIIEILRNL
ncbi:MAG: DUF4112 domain-containing protein [Acidobacteria bacterium]|jgi:hypothetical protein|nr:MAG: DUF4112 domain-containing protein [Acidobacteriota bacterium]GIU81413.1 MAG: hypothetical protein KatS3mg006_0477 [Pyrinomonadaceae bacterium]